MMITVSILAAAAVQTSGSAFGEIVGLKGSGTVNDPYLISSANDLRKVSDSHHLHSGAYYEQTEDIIFNDDLSGSTATLSVIADENEVTVLLSLNTGRKVSEAYACVSFNDNVKLIDWNEGFGAVSFSIAGSGENNSVIAAGSADGETFAIGLSFAQNDKSAVITAPFKGNFKPIGSEEMPFKGNYNGGGHSIKGLRIASVSSDAEKKAAAGLFGCTADSRLYDISVVSEKDDRSYIIAAFIAVPVPGTNIAPSVTSGGITALNSGSSIISCSVESTISSLVFERSVPGSGPYADSIKYVSAGGIMGSGVGKLTECRVSGTVSAVAAVHLVTKGSDGPGYSFLRSWVSVYAGGLAGAGEDIEITKSKNTASVYGVSSCTLHVTAGDGSLLKGVYQALTEMYLGGIAGIAGLEGSGKITDTYNTGSVAAASYYSAGDAEDTFELISISGCTNLGVVSRFFNTGDIKIDHQMKEDGGDARSYPVSPSYAEESYYTGNLTITSPGAVRIGDDELDLQSTFKRWDFDRIWTMKDGHPEICLRYDMMIRDASGTFGGAERYSLDHSYYFNENGTAFSFAGKDGFALTLNKGYEDSDITIYMMNDNKTILEKNGSNYMIPGSFFLQAYLEDREISLIDLYIDGLKLTPMNDDDDEDDDDAVADDGTVGGDGKEAEKETDGTDGIVALSGGKGITALLAACMLIIILAILTVYNAMNTREILSLLPEEDTEGK
jgi:hypothetical protein